MTEIGNWLDQINDGPSTQNVPNYDEVKNNGKIMKKKDFAKIIFCNDHVQFFRQISKALEDYQIKLNDLDLPERQIYYQYYKYAAFVFSQAMADDQTQADQIANFSANLPNIHPPLTIPSLRPEDQIEQTTGPLTCTICVSKKVTIFMEPCGHTTICLGCFIEWGQNRCATCNQPVESVNRLFIGDVPELPTKKTIKDPVPNDLFDDEPSIFYQITTTVFRQIFRQIFRISN